MARKQCQHCDHCHGGGGYAFGVAATSGYVAVFGNAPRGMGIGYVVFGAELNLTLSLTLRPNLSRSPNPQAAVLSESDVTNKALKVLLLLLLNGVYHSVDVVYLKLGAILIGF